MLDSRQTTFLFILGGSIVALVLLFLLRGVLAPFVIGALLAWMLVPLRPRVQSLGCSESIASGILVAAVVVLFLSGFLVLLPVVVSEINNALAALESQVRSGNLSGRSLFGFNWGESLSGLLQESATTAGSLLNQINKWLLQPLLSGGAALLGAFYFLFVVPLTGFFMLRDWEGFTGKGEHWVPRPWVPVLQEFSSDSRKLVAQWIRGVAIVIVLLSVVYIVGLSLIGLTHAVSVGLFAGLISFIPFIGGLFGILVAGGLSIVEFGFGWQTWAIALLFIFVQVAETNFITPKLVGGTIGMHPLVAVFALFIGGSLFGLLGVMLALPISAILGLVMRQVFRIWTNSRLYNSGFAKGLDLDL
jgi:predicted PurR-regulated permease PerM